MTPYAGLLGRVGEQPGGGPIDRVLACLPAARSRAGGEDRDIRTGKYAGHRRDIGLLGIEYGGLPAGRGQISLVIRVPHEPDHFVTVTTQQFGQPQSDLPMSTRNHDSHTPSLTLERIRQTAPVPHATAADGTRIAYQVRGEGQPLVLLAGQSNNHHWWDPIRADFEAAYRTITLDWRGTGDSDKPDEVYSTPGFADDVVAVLDHLGLDRAHVYGTSMGGRVAQWIAINHPSRVRALVLGCTSPGAAHGYERSNEIRRALADPARTGAVLLDLMYTPAWRAANPGPYPVLGDKSMPSYAKARHLVASNKHDAWDGLPGITAPTLILHGTDDIFSPVANAQLLADRIPHARAELIGTARHAYFHEFRSVAGPLVLDFLAAQDRA